MVHVEIFDVRLRAKPGRTHDQRSDLGPGLGLGSIREQVHDDSSAVDSLLNWEKGLSGNLSMIEEEAGLAMAILCQYEVCYRTKRSSIMIRCHVQLTVKIFRSGSMALCGVPP